MIPTLTLLSFPPAAQDAEDFFDSSGALRLHQGHIYSMHSHELTLLASGVSKFRNFKYRHGMLFILKDFNTLEIVGMQTIVSSDAILGFDVLWHGELILILVSGLEFYALKNSWEKIKKIDVAIHWYAMHQNILLLSSSQSKAFPIYSLSQGHLASRLDSYKIDIQVSETELIQKRNFIMFHMRSELYLGFLNDFSGHGMKLIISKYSKGKYKFHKILDLKSKDVELIIDDNALVVIDVIKKGFEIYDLWTLKNDSCLHKGKIEIGTDDPIKVVSRYLKNLQTGLYYDISIDSNCLIREAVPSAGLISFVIYRPDSKEHIIYILLEMMKNRTSCKELMNAFHFIHSYSLPVVVNNQHLASDSILDFSDHKVAQSEKSSPSVLSRTVRFVESIYGFLGSDSNNQKHFLLAQEDAFALVFTCLVEIESINLADYVFIYMRSLIDIKETPAPYFSELLAKLYIQGNRLPELFDMIRHGILVESSALAKSLIVNSIDSTTLSFQIGIDILRRMGEHEEIVSTFLAHNMVLEALAFTTAINKPELINASKILEQAYKTGNKNLFFTVYKYCENGGVVLGESIDRYVSIFREMWADFVYLEAME